MATSFPAARNSRATAAPIPVPPPVTRTADTEQDQRAGPRGRRVLVAGQRVVPGVGRAPGRVRRRAEHDVLADHDRVQPGPFGLNREPDQVGHVRYRPHRPVLGQDQDDPYPAHTDTRTGSAFSPLVKFDRIRRGSPASSNRPTRRGQVHAQAQVRAAAAEAPCPRWSAPRRRPRGRRRLWPRRGWPRRCPRTCSPARSRSPRPRTRLRVPPAAAARTPRMALRGPTCQDQLGPLYRA